MQVFGDQLCRFLAAPCRQRPIAEAPGASLPSASRASISASRGSREIGAPRESIEAEGAKQQQQGQRVARKFHAMLLGTLQCLLGLAFDHRGHDLDMLFACDNNIAQEAA
ncbi:hypothetical protein [Bradyrhizobium cenepequi]